MDYAKIKTEARERIKDHLWDIWKPIIIIGVISGVFQAVANGIFGADSMFTSFVQALLNLLLVPAEIGCTAYILKFVRGEKYSIDDLKEYYPKFGVLIVINIIMSVFIMLGFIFLIIPGIIISLWYAMVSYIFVDNPDLQPTEYLERSKSMMDGYKMDYFVFGLTFIGWILLCIFIIPAIWVVPYMEVAMTLYYEELRKVKEGTKSTEPKKEKVIEATVEEVKEEPKEEVKVEEKVEEKKAPAKKPAAKKTTTKTTAKKTTTTKKATTAKKPATKKTTTKKSTTK